MLTIDAYPANQAFPAPRTDSRIQISSPAAASASEREVPVQAKPAVLATAQVTSPAASAAPTVDADEPSPLSVNVTNTTENTVIGQAPYGDRTKPPQDVTW
jgi:hypothetical protein